MRSDAPLTLTHATLDDGLTVTRQEPPAGSPSVAFTYLGPAGTAHDPAALEGLAVLVADVAVVAAGADDRRAFARRLDALGATLGSEPSPECVEITVQGPKERWAELLDLLADVVRRPRFEAADLAVARRQLLERQLREATQPDSRADTAFLETLYPRGHPYHRTGVGTRTSVARIGRAEVRRFHRDQFVPDGAHLVATAALELPALQRAVAARFAGWERPRAPALTGTERPVRARGADLRLAMVGRAQVELRLGGPSVRRLDPTYPAVFLGNEVLGGRPLLARLFQHIRERAGLAYHAASEVEAMTFGGFWIARAGTGPERAARVERLLAEEVARIVERPIPSDELDRIRESAIGTIALALETTSGVHDFALEGAYYGLPGDYYRTWPDRLRALRPPEIRDAMRAGFDPTRAIRVTSGA